MHQHVLVEDLEGEGLGLGEARITHHLVRQRFVDEAFAVPVHGDRALIDRQDARSLLGRRAPREDAEGPLHEGHVGEASADLGRHQQPIAGVARTAGPQCVLHRRGEALEELLALGEPATGQHDGPGTHIDLVIADFGAHPDDLFAFDKQAAHTDVAADFGTEHAGMAAEGVDHRGGVDGV